MAVWCFVCDRPVEGETCPGCGRPGTVVPDPVDESRATPLVDRLRRVPRGAWIAMVVVVIVILFTLLQSGFRLE